ncbi:hypothetical protein [Murid betaherpesvirus 1]|uniref:M124 protein n=5 Tax=Murid herpesvirus 1 TaxID=10366 RepID=D3XDU7_MUHVS|nr:hypothetical protein QKG64_gp113 [Murid betaherpesvirus 1]YP_214124.1 hypothetical protein MuHV1_gp115 [Murid betaherpesvirus 1]ACE95299.1 m124 [Muromegalovirus G4]ACE95463.1 m124 [Muromegalovirus WP15B]CAP08161.1 m124 protein [Murine cytomegalovirus (strain K181)]ADD10491.1 hypothetical protein [Murid betaherpesvirus 1]AQQ81288.1 m124 protein [Murid betaherpesvirus 1]
MEAPLTQTESSVPSPNSPFFLSGPRFSGRGKRDLRSTSNNTQELTESSTGKEHHSRPPRWLQPLSTIFCILLIFGLIMAAVACNIWCVNTGDDLSSHGDSILDIELASSAGATDT